MSKGTPQERMKTSLQVEKLEMEQSLAQNPGLFPQPRLGHKGELHHLPHREDSKTWKRQVSRVRGWAFPARVEGGVERSEPRPILVAPGNPGL